MYVRIHLGTVFRRTNIKGVNNVKNYAQIPKII